MGNPCCFCFVIYVNLTGRIRLREKLGIQPRPSEDLLCTLCCPCCANGQEALAVDKATGVQISLDVHARGLKVDRVGIPQQHVSMEERVTAGSRIDEAVM